jgi:hypothetical protein
MEFDRMLRPVFLGLICCLSVSSCEKARNLASKAKDVVKQQVGGGANKKDGKGGPVDPELKDLIDETPEGIRLRNDLPFPSKVTVSTEIRAKMDLRYFASSPLGREAKNFNGVVEQKLEMTLDGATATLVQEDTRVVPDLPDEPEKKAEVLMKGGSITMVRKKDGWAPSGNGKSIDFSFAAKVAGPEFTAHVEENGLSPRRFWFGKGRLKQGDVLTLAGDHLEMLRFTKSSGTIELKFEGIEAIHGHPCGVFSISGAAATRIRDFLGSGTGGGDLTLESGKLWLSLLYPIVLREEIDAIFSVRAGKMDENLSRSDGKVSYVTERKWKISPDPS